MNLSPAVYMPQLKWKFGEMKAVGTAIGGSSGRLLPLFRIPPAGSYDHMEGRTLGTAEYIKSFGAKLAGHWKGLTFIEGDLIDDDRHCDAVGRHALTELLERARMAHVAACPVVSLARSPAYQAAVRRFRELNQSWPICLKLSLAQIDLLSDPARLLRLLDSYKCHPADTVLLIDAGPVYIPNVDEFANVIIEALASLSAAGPFAKVFWSSTTFPEKHKLKPGQTGRYPRHDWMLFKRLAERAKELPIAPLFSDYGLEYPAYYKPVQAAPSAHLRYSTSDEYLIVKGTTTKKPFGYKSIFPVAQQLVEADCYYGASHSLGDAYIDALAKGLGKTGHAGMWRWASTDHHLTSTLAELARVLDLPPDYASAARYVLSNGTDLTSGALELPPTISSNPS